MGLDVHPGTHVVQWSGKNQMGQDVASGMYFYKLKVGNLSFQKKLLLLR